MSRQTVVKPLGMITQPNKLGQYPPGALALVQNGVFRNPGEVSSVRTPLTATSIASANDTILNLFQVNAGKQLSACRSAGDVWDVRYFFPATFPALFSTTGLLSATGFINPFTIREKLVLNSMEGMLVADSIEPSSAGDATFRQAGMPQPHFGGFGTNTATGAAVATDVMVGYVAVFRRVLANGYQIVSVPTPIYRFRNSAVGTLANMLCTVVWDANSGLAAGDILEIYRTNGISTTSSDSDPGTYLNMVLSYTLQSADIVATSVTVTDRQMMFPTGSLTTPGEALYCSPGQEGLLAVNRQPNISRACGTFKGYAFYGNITERPQWKFQCPGGFGVQDVAVASGVPVAYFKQFGIGERTGAGTVAIGNATITGISAADIVGLRQGQIWTGSTGVFAAGTRVNSVGGTSITMSANALSNSATFRVADVIQINGVDTQIRDLSDFFLNLGTNVTTGAGVRFADYEITCDQPVSTSANITYISGAKVTIEPVRPAALTSFTIRATNGANYSPPVPEFTATAQAFSQTRRPNLLQWSKNGQPEHVPPSNTSQVGTGAIAALASTRDAMWILCTDGAYRLSGDGGQWRIDPVDNTCVITGPQAWTVLHDNVYLYSNQGVVRMIDTGAVRVSDEIYGDVLPGQPYAENQLTMMERNETDDEVYLVAPISGSPRFHVYNVVQQAFSQMTDTPFTNVTALGFSRNPASGLGKLVIGRSPLGGLQPTHALWDPDALAFGYMGLTLQFQPIYSEGPAIAKQWIDATWIFDPVSTGLAPIQSWSGAIAGSATTIKASPTDVRVTYGVPRRVALHPTVAPGLVVPATTTITRFSALSLRYAALGEQQVRR